MYVTCRSSKKEGRVERRDIKERRAIVHVREEFKNFLHVH